MTIVQTITTVSHRYYAKRRKSDTAGRIRDMQRLLGDEQTPTAELVKLTADQLATMALRLHARFPE